LPIVVIMQYVYATGYGSILGELRIVAQTNVYSPIKQFTGLAHSKFEIAEKCGCSNLLFVLAKLKGFDISILAN
jgi:hypothetical protein